MKSRLTESLENKDFQNFSVWKGKRYGELAKTLVFARGDAT